MTEPGPDWNEGYRHFFKVLVGDAEKRDNLALSLGAAVNAGREEGHDPYEALYDASRDALNQTADEVQAWAKELPGHEKFAAKNKPNTRTMDFVLGSLAAIGRIHENHTGVPQKHDTVTQNAYEAVTYIHGTAFMAGITAKNNLSALAYGLNPTGPVRTRASRRGIHEQVQDEAFSVTTDVEGQLLISPRYSLLQDDGKRRCPAARDSMRVDGKRRNSLLTFLYVVADVTVDYIYPHQFPLLPKEEAR